MRLNTNFFRIRLTMTIAPIATVFFIYCCFKLILPNYLETTKNLITERGIIQSIYPTRETRKVLLNTSYPECLDIKLYDKKYIIRLTDKFEEDKWAIINNTNNISKTIEIKSSQIFPDKGIVYNPRELTIDQEVIIHFNDDKPIIFWIFVGFLIVGLLFGFTSYLAIKTYILEFLPSDKITLRNGTWKLIKVWLNDWFNI